MDKFFGLDNPSYKDDELELIATAYDRVYLAIIQGLLDEAEIPYLVKDRGSALKIIAGYSFFGSDIYVHKNNLETAVELLDAFDEANGENHDADDAGTEEETDEETDEEI